MRKSERIETEQSLKESLQQTAETIKINIAEMECMPDHIHLLVECSPQHFIPDMIKEEREIPPLMSRNYMNPNTVKKKEYLLLHAFD